MQNNTSSALANYFADQRTTRIATEVVRESLARTFIAKLVTRAVVIGVASTLFVACSPTTGFVTLAVCIVLL